MFKQICDMENEILRATEGVVNDFTYVFIFVNDLRGRNRVKNINNTIYPNIGGRLILSRALFKFD